MYLVLSIFIVVYVMGIMFVKYRCLYCPPILSGLVWLFSYSIVLFLSKNSIDDSPIYMAFAVSYLFFCIGFDIAYKIKNSKKNLKQRRMQHYGISFKRKNSYLMLILIYFMMILSIYSIRICFSSINPLVVWQNIKNLESIPYIFGVTLNISTIYSIILFYLFLTKKIKKKFFYLSLVPVVLLSLGASRTVWFTTLVFYFFTYTYTRKPSLKKFITSGLKISLIVIIIFILSSIVKFSNVMGENTIFEQLYFYVYEYFATPMQAFVKWYSEFDKNYTYGLYIFRIFYAVLSKFDNSIVVPETVREFIVVNGFATNVYTSLQWYVYDFGLFGNYIIFGLLGTLFGILYKKHKLAKNNMLIIILLSLLSSIIVGQYYAEQLFTQASTWIQRFLSLIIFYKFLFKRKKVIARDKVTQNSDFVIKEKKDLNYEFQREIGEF